MYVWQNIMQKNNNKYTNVKLQDNFFLQNSSYITGEYHPMTCMRFSAILKE